MAIDVWTRYGLRTVRDDQRHLYVHGGPRMGRGGTRMDREEFETEVGDLVADAVAGSLDPGEVIEVLKDQIRNLKQQQSEADDVPDGEVD